MKKLLIIGLVLLSCGVGVLAWYKKPLQSASVAQKATQKQVEIVSIPDCSFSKLEVIQLFNEVRENDLVGDSYLDKIAQQRADSLTNGPDNHEGFEVLAHDGTLSNYYHVGEILDSNVCLSAQKAFSDWKNSEKHWSAINNEIYSHVGIGYRNLSDGRNTASIAVAIFGQ